jgi:serine protease DegQ
MKTHRVVAASAIAFVVLLAGCSSGDDSSSAASAASTRSTTSAASSATTPTTRSALGGASRNLASAAANNWSQIPAITQRVAPSIVTIETSEGLGSGVIYSASGEIATDAHVVGSSKTVTVAFADGKHVKGTVQATDPVTDVAAVKVSRSGLPAASFEPTLPVLGDLTIAIGSPLGFTNSVTAGVVSGLNRSIPGSASQTQSLVDLIQTDAAISPGNSGGALVDGNGKVIGLAEAYIPPSQGAVSLGFAIPSPVVTDAMSQLISKGSATHAFLGVSATDVTSDMQQQFGLSASSGALVQDVGSGSPAAKAGIRAGDVITAIGGERVTNSEDLIAAIRGGHPGERVKVTYNRDGKKTTTEVTLSRRPSQ